MAMATQMPTANAASTEKRIPAAITQLIGQIGRANDRLMELRQCLRPVLTAVPKDAAQPEPPRPVSEPSIAASIDDQSQKIAAIADTLEEIRQNLEL